MMIRIPRLGFNWGGRCGDISCTVDGAQNQVQSARSDLTVLDAVTTYPPYYVKGRELYHDFYKPEDRAAVASFVVGGNLKQRWMVSYDNVKEIRTLHSAARHVVYDVGYRVRSRS